MYCTNVKLFDYTAGAQRWVAVESALCARWVDSYKKSFVNALSFESLSLIVCCV